ncbi:MAG TPA: SBBP repeat-containing protein, partial [Polyangiales bacterium]|nr:SBBP repeat-containing protein [Polyangiales bacterium]
MRCVNHHGCGARWSLQVGTSYDDEASSLAVDAHGNIYTSFYGPQPFWTGAEELSTNVFTLRIDANGSHRWMDAIEYNANETVVAVSIGQKDDVFVVGSTDGMLT